MTMNISLMTIRNLVSGDKKLLVKDDCDDDAGEYQQTFYLCIVPVHLRAIRC